MVPIKLCQGPWNCRRPNQVVVGDCSAVALGRIYKVSEGRKVGMLGAWSFIELNLFDSRKAACLIGGVGVWRDWEGNQRGGWMATNLGDKTGQCGSLKDIKG